MIPRPTLIVTIMDFCIPIFIVIFFLIAIYYTIRYFTCKTIKYPYDWIYWFIMIVSGIWVAIWIYYLISISVPNAPILKHQEDTFLFLLVRPTILLTAVGTCILQKLKYMKAKRYGGKLCKK